MASFSTLRDQLKIRLATISGLNTYDVVPEYIQSPAAVVGAPFGREWQINYVINNGPPRVAEWIIPIRVYVGANDSITAQDRLDQYLDSTGANSIKVAIEGDRTLGGFAQTCRVTKAENYGVAGEFLSVEFRVEIIA
jgi:hypothetical protein